MSLLDLVPIRPAQKVLFATTPDAKVLLLSMREMADLVAFCALYEFEDLVASVTSADMARPANFENLEVGRKVYKATHYLGRATKLVPAFRPQIGARRIDRNYELFFPVFNNPYELYALQAIEGWRKHCRVAICFINEIWQGSVPEYLLELAKDFDHIFLGMAGSTAQVAKITGRPCSYLPLGVDALKFAPPSSASPRTIDICGIGRRSPVTHAALLALAVQKGYHYFYDTVRTSGVPDAARQMTFRVNNPAEHRYLLANLLKRSRYFIANRARVNEKVGKDEIAGRFYEGTAAGAILLGEAPDCDEFRKHFSWPDAVIPVPFGSSEVAAVIAAIDADPERAQRIQRENVAQALLRHDWIYRLRTVFETAGLSPTAAMIEREARLLTRATEIRRPRASADKPAHVSVPARIQARLEQAPAAVLSK
jgi:hypothetical protein